MGCSPNVRSNVVLMVSAQNVVGTARYHWGTLSGCTLVSGGDSNPSTWSCPHAAAYAGAVTVTGDNGTTTRNYTVPICGAPTLQ
jgi:hypothetical protein